MTSLGIDVGGTKLLGVVIDDAGNVLFEERLPTPMGKQALLDALADLANRLCDKTTGSDAPTTLGLGIPGPIDPDGRLVIAPNLRGVEDVVFAKELGGKVPASVSFIYPENDANVAAWGERSFGAGDAKNNVILITLGTGIGGGIILQGDLLRGNNGHAAEVGHMVLDPYGPFCSCGQRGCWERFGSGSGLARLAREEAHANLNSTMVGLAGGDPEAVRGEHVVQAAREGDDSARNVMTRYTRWVALGLANLANLFDPERFVIGGGLIEAGEFVLGPIRDGFNEIPYHAKTEIVAATLGEHAGAIGAADLARVKAVSTR